MNLSYGTQLSQAAEYLIQLKQKQEKAITTKAHYPGLHTTLKLLALCPSAESCSRDRVRTGWRIWCQPHKDQAPWPCQAVPSGGHLPPADAPCNTPYTPLPAIPKAGAWPICSAWWLTAAQQLCSCAGSAKARTSEGSRDKQRSLQAPVKQGGRHLASGPRARITQHCCHLYTQQSNHTQPKP